MKYSLILLVLIVVVLIPNSVYAWPDPKYIKPSHIKWGDVGVQWTQEAEIAMITGKVLVPPFLNTIQIGRWKIASPSARPRLAQLYGIPKEVAEKCGAFYLEIQSNTKYGYPASYPMGKKSP